MKKNRLYQQRWREKKKAELGREEFNKLNNKYLQKYREARKKAEGYVKPEPVKEIPLKPPLQTIKKIVLKPITNINKSTQKAKKTILNIEVQKKKLTLKPLSDKSIENYLQNITTLHHNMTNEQLGSWRQEIIKVLKGQSYGEKGLKQQLPYFKMNNIQKKIKSLRDKYQNDNSFKTKINAITSFLGRLTGMNKEFIYFSELGIKLQEQYTKTRDLNEISQEDLDTINLIKFSDGDIRKNINKLENTVDKVLYSIYMYIPRRLEVLLVQIRFSSKNTDKGNYLILDRNKIPNEFIFNSYKTDKTYGKQIVRVPDEIKDILHQYILEKEFKSYQYLFSLDRSNKENYDESGFSAKFIGVFNFFYERHITNQTLRIAYASYWTPRAKNIAETRKKRIANDLSHDYLTHEKYLKYNVV